MVLDALFHFFTLLHSLCVGLLPFQPCDVGGHSVCEERARPTLLGLARTEYKTEDSTSVQQNKHQGDTFFCGTASGHVPDRNLFCRVAVWGTEVRKHAVALDRVGRGFGCCFAVGSGPLSLPKHVMNFLADEKSEVFGISWDSL